MGQPGRAFASIVDAKEDKESVLSVFPYLSEPGWALAVILTCVGAPQPRWRPSAQPLTQRLPERVTLNGRDR